MDENYFLSFFLLDSDVDDSKSTSFKIDGHGSNTENSLAHFYKNNLHTDIDFEVECGNKTFFRFSAHQLVLSLWSSRFASLFSLDNTGSEKKVIVVNDVLPSIFEVILEYCYGSAALLEHNHNDISFLLKVYKAAEIYKVNGLQRDCCKMFINSFPTKDNVFELLEAASITGSDSLKQRCHKVLQTQTGDIFSSYSIICPSVIDTILDLPSLSLRSEFDLINWMFEWGTSCKEDKSLQQVMEPYLPRLDFLSLSAEEFGQLVAKHRGFFDEKEAFSVFMNIASPGSWSLPPWCADHQAITRYLNAETSTESLLGDNSLMSLYQPAMILCIYLILHFLYINFWES